MKIKFAPEGFIAYNSWLAKLVLPRNYSTIMLFGLIFTKHATLSEATIRHENIHRLQFFECGMLGILSTIMFGNLWLSIGAALLLYYVLYLLNYAFIRLNDSTLSQVDAYYRICFEQEAYCNEFKPTYLHDRYMFAWLNYID